LKSPQGKSVGWIAPCLRRRIGLAAIGCLGLTLSACTGWPGPYMSVRHLSDNPIDQAIWHDRLDEIRGAVRRRLLARYAPGRPIAEVLRSLERFGAKCTDKPDGPVVCRYTQFLFIGNRGIFGDEWREFEYFDFTVRLLARGRALHEFGVCYTTTKEVQEGPVFGKPNKPRKSKFKPCP